MIYNFIHSVVLLMLFISANNLLKADELSVAFEKDTVFNDISTVRVKGYYSKILIKRTNGESVKLRAVLKSTNPEGYRIVTKITNKVLDVWVTFPQESWSSHTGELVFCVPDSVNIDVESTSGYCTINEVNAKTVNVTTKSGKIYLNKCSGNLILSSGTGNVHLDEIQGNVNVRSKSADIFICRINGDVLAYSSSGMLRLDNISGKVKTVSTSGRQEMANIKGDILAKSMSGFIKISVAQGTIQILGSSGDIQLFQTTGTLDIKTTKGNQSGTRINLTGNSRFNSTEGKIKIRFDMPKESIKYQLVSEKAYIFALGKSKKKKLNIGDGSILVESTSTTGAQAYY